MVKITNKLFAPTEIIERKILVMRDQKVMVDSDLAEIYCVETRSMIQAVRRNTDRFPNDFMFQLSAEEFESLTSQIVISKVGRGGRRHLPYVITEHGVSMLSSVLNSPRAIKMNIFIIRAFIKMRELLLMDKVLELRILKLETSDKERKKDIDDIISILRRITEHPIKPPGKMGFVDRNKQED